MICIERKAKELDGLGPPCIFWYTSQSLFGSALRAISKVRPVLSVFRVEKFVQRNKCGPRSGRLDQSRSKYRTGGPSDRPICCPQQTDIHQEAVFACVLYRTPNSPLRLYSVRMYRFRSPQKPF